MQKGRCDRCARESSRRLAGTPSAELLESARDVTFGTYVILRVADVASSPRLTDVLVDPVGLHLQGVLDYASRDLLVVLGSVN